jgi:hypothetical protein
MTFTYGMENKNVSELCMEKLADPKSTTWSLGLRHVDVTAARRKYEVRVPWRHREGA